MIYDVVVIGAGPGGYTAAIRASQLGLKVAIVEEGDFGGTCLNRGCIPTKVLLNAVYVLHSVKMGKDFGIVGDITIDLDKLKSFKNKTVKKFSKGIETLLKNNHVDLYKGKASFINEKIVDVEDKKIEGKYFVIASGSYPVSLPIKGIDKIDALDSTKALELERIPEKLLIVGAGIIGLEFACIYHGLGSKVTIVELLDDFLPVLDRDTANILYKSLINRGINIYLSSKVVEVDKQLAKVDIKGKEINLPFDSILIAVGRKPNYRGLEKLTFLMENGNIVVDNKMHSKIDNIYAIGDVVGPYQLAHVASYQGIIAAHNIAGFNKQVDYKAVPSCIYTNPEVAWVGLNEITAKQMYGDIKIGTFPYFILPKAALEGEREGLIKVIADKDNNKLLGVSIVGKGATEIIHEAVLAIKLGLTVENFTSIIHAHPTISEGIKEACEDLLGYPINKLKM